MSAPSVHIDKIHLALHGVSPAVAREALASLGPALAEALAAHSASPLVRADAEVESLTLPAINLGAAFNARALREALARALAAGVANHLPQATSR